MIHLTGVTRTFADVVALADLSLHVTPGEVVGLLGHNGAGKTTAVRLVAGLLAPTGGTVRVDGRDPDADGQAVRRRLGVLPANPAVDDRLTARQNLEFVADLFELPTAGLARRVDSLLDRFDLAGGADEHAGGFSTGMRQRLSLARVLLHDPDVLLLDEPTASLDPVATRMVRGIIAELGHRNDRTVVLCTQDLAEAQQLCDQVVILEHGRVIARAPPNELATRAPGAAVAVEVHPDDVVAAAAVRTGGASGTQSGPGVVAWPGMTREQIPALVADLAAAGVRVYGVAHHQPTLEDVYLQLHAGDVTTVPA